MKVPIYSEKGIKTESTIELPKEIFEIKPRTAALRQFIHIYQVNQSQGTVATKTRGEVSGGGRKPWAQKGTGRARQGSIRSPIWVGGGTTFGPQPRDLAASLPKKTRDLALRSALSEKAAAGRVLVVGEFAPKEPQTSLAARLLRKLNARVPLVVVPGKDPKIIRSFRNIPGVVLGTVSTLNPYEIVRAGSVILLKDSVSQIKVRLGNKPSPTSAKKTVRRAPARKAVPAKKAAKRKSR